MLKSQQRTHRRNSGSCSEPPRSHGGRNIAREVAPVTARFVLALDFRADLNADPPKELSEVVATSTEAEQSARAIAKLLRRAPPCGLQGSSGPSCAGVEPAPGGSRRPQPRCGRHLPFRGVCPCWSGAGSSVRAGEYERVIAVADAASAVSGSPIPWTAGRSGKP